MANNHHEEDGRPEINHASQNHFSREEILSEIENGLEHTDKTTLFKLLATLKIGYDARKPSPFDWLPDEMLMKIIRMTINDLGDQRHHHLVDNIAKISSRFKNLAADKSLWKAVVYTFKDRFNMKEVIDKFLQSEVEEVEFKSLSLILNHALPNDDISAEDISALLEKCQDIRRIKLSNRSKRKNTLCNRYATSIWSRHDMMKLFLSCPGWGLVPLNGADTELPLEKNRGGIFKWAPRLAPRRVFQETRI